jgi:hypothetical protein
MNAHRAASLILVLFLLGYSQDGFIKTIEGRMIGGSYVDYNVIFNEINSTVPIAAEYCLQESSDKETFGKWEIRLFNVLDTVTKFYPYEYEEIRECEWYDEPDLHLGDLGGVFFKNDRGTQYNGYRDEDIPETAKTVVDYYAILKDKFYAGLKYQNIWGSIKFEEHGIALGSNYIGVVPIDWAWGCHFKNENKKDDHYSIGGTYNIRITGKCSKEDLKKAKELYGD